MVRHEAVAATLRNGDVLIAGGYDNSRMLSSAEVFRPSAGTFTALPQQMTVARLGAVAAPLPNGEVLIAGGENGIVGLTSAEVFDPRTGTFTALPKPPLCQRPARRSPSRNQ